MQHNLVIVNPFVDMMPSINDLMVIVLIPVLDYLVYPHMKKSMNVHVKPLQKVKLYPVFCIHACVYKKWTDINYKFLYSYDHW